MIPIETINYQFKDKGVDKFPSRMLGIRYYDLSKTTPDINCSNVYDDLMVVCDGEESHEFIASVDPGDHWIKHPMTAKGCARLQVGLYWYKVGIHRDHTAFVQAEGVNVERLDKKGIKISEEKDVFIGCNIHSGGYEEYVERWSAGCQVIYSPEGPWGKTWNRFLQKSLQLMGKHRQNRIPYLLIDALKAVPIEA